MYRLPEGGRGASDLEHRHVQSYSWSSPTAHGSSALGWALPEWLQVCVLSTGVCRVTMALRSRL